MISHRLITGGYEGHADRLEVELVPDAGHFLVDEKPDLVAARASPAGAFRRLLAPALRPASPRGAAAASAAGASRPGSERSRMSSRPPGITGSRAMLVAVGEAGVEADVADRLFLGAAVRGRRCR